MRILRRALDDLRIESIQLGRLPWFEQLLPALIDPGLPPEQIPPGALQGRELMLALQRLRQRLRERIDVQLRELAPDLARRRGLRQRLHDCCTNSGEIR